MAIYIDPSAAVNGIGTEASPYNSIYNVTPVANETYRLKRGTVQILEDTYATTSLVSSPATPLTFEDYGDPSLPKPVLHRITSKTFNVTGNTSNVVFRNLLFSGKSSANSLLYILNGVNNLSILDCEFNHEDLSLGRCIFYQNNPTIAPYSHTIARCVFYSGLYGIAFQLGAPTAVVPEGFFIDSCSFYNVAEGVRFTVEPAANIGCGFRNITLNNCAFINTRGTAANIRGGYLADTTFGPINIQSYNLVMSNNKFYGCGIQDQAATTNYSFWSNVDIYGNHLKYCASKGSLIHGLHNQYIYIHDNVCEDARPSNTIDGSGIFPDEWSDMVYIYRNKILNNKGTPGVQNSGEGIAIWKCSNIFVFSNIIYNCVRGFNVGGAPAKPSENIYVYNNTFIDIPITSMSFDRDGVGLASNAVYLANNLFVNSPVGIDPGGAPQTLCFNNHFVNVTTPYLDTQLPGSGDVIYATQAEVKLNSDFSPQADSPLVHAGQFMGYRRDFKGNQMHNPPSIGALEYEPPRKPRP